jgi:hypothetical protein
LFCSASCPAVLMTSLISGELHGLWVEHLVDEAKKVSPSAVHYQAAIAAASFRRGARRV